jgi:glutaredoxin
MLKRKLDEDGVIFREINLDELPASEADGVRKYIKDELGFQATPVLKYHDVFYDEDFVFGGFAPQRVKELEAKIAGARDHRNGIAVAEVYANFGVQGA